MKTKYLKLALLTMGLLATYGFIQSDDPISVMARNTLEKNINSYLELLAIKTTSNELNQLDKAFLYAGLTLGIGLSVVQYPEASSSLYHYVFGDGSDLELDSSYFSQSEYLGRIINKKGLGLHGPISLKQADDWRLSLVFNPYYLKISEDNVRIYHPKMSFEPTYSKNRVVTTIPIGKIKLKVHDKLVSALAPKSFYVYSEWERKSDK